MAEKKTFHVLVVDNEQELSERIGRLFEQGEIKVTHEAAPGDTLNHFEKNQVDMLFFSGDCVRSPDVDINRLLEILTLNSPHTQVVMLIDPDELDHAFTALHNGAFQYAKNPLPDEELTHLIELVRQQQPEMPLNHLLKGKKKKIRLDAMIMKSVVMQQVYGYIQKAAQTDIPILLVGETGTGKDLTAQAIHRHSARAEGPFVAVNLGAVPSELVASELFGHEKGSFTGAAEKRQGRFEQASGGTIFLDEIEAIDEKVQISLLRLLETQQFERVGGGKVIKTDARVIAATNQDLETLVKEGKLRRDLFYRLDVFRFELPPLRKRHGDLPVLIEEFIKHFCRVFDKNIRGLSLDCYKALETYDWPGNIRELKNVLQRAVLICDDQLLQPAHLPTRFTRDQEEVPTVTFRVGVPLQEMEREMVVQALATCRNNRKRTAEILGISRRALYNKLEKYQLA